MSGIFRRGYLVWGGRRVSPSIEPIESRHENSSFNVNVVCSDTYDTRESFLIGIMLHGGLFLL